ncbi:MAG TPA: TolC family protein [Chitinophagaceae bacterium]|nr:TolC family protein [Chitinophagaceae bacterium]
MTRSWFPKGAGITLLLLSTAAAAQQRYEVSAKDAVDIAFQNVAELRNARLDQQITEARNREVTALAYPQVSGSVQVNHYLSLPLIQFPDATELAIYDVLKREGVRDSNGNPITGNGQFQVRNFSFFSPWNVNGGATVQQLLFEPQVFVGLQARRTLRESSALQVKVQEDKVRESVYRSYYGVLIAEKQLWFVQESLKRLQRLSADMDVMFRNGFVERLDIDKTNVAVNNTRSAENQLKNGIAIGYAVLKMTIGLSQSDTLVLKDSLSTADITQGLLETFSYDDRNEIRFLNKALDLQRYDVKRHRLSYFPTVAAFYNFQKVGQRNSATLQASDPWFWYNINLVGLSVNIPIFDGGQKRQRIRQSQFTLQKLENSLDQAKKGIDLERTTARSTLASALINLSAQEENMRLAQKVYETEKKKYEAGLGSSFAILQADTELQQAQSNYFRSLYDAIIARITHLKALGKL